MLVHRALLLIAVLWLAAPPMVRADQADDFINAQMKMFHLHGISIAVIKNGQLLKADGYGLADDERRTPARTDTVYKIGSVSKQFIATGIILLVRDGRVGLDDPISKYIDGAPAAWRPITVRHLLTHTSGLPDYTTSTFDYRKDYTEDELARFAFAQKTEFPAGSRWNYSNTGYALLGFIVHKVSGQFYGDVLADRVFKPLGMTTARIIDEADVIPNRAAGYQLVDGQLKNQDWVAPKLNTTADGSLYLSLRDLLVWNAAVKRRAILKPQSWQAILTPVRLQSGKTYPYGMGWSIDTRNGRALLNHGGAWQGFKAYIGRYVDDKMTVILFANQIRTNQTKIAHGVAAIFNPELAPTEK